MTTGNFFRGRQLLLTEIPITEREHLEQIQISQVPTMALTGTSVRCLRCGTRHPIETVRLGQGNPAVYYCPTCILLGRVQSDQVFYWQPERRQVRPRQVVFAWSGTLSPSQQQGSVAIKRSIQRQTSLLIHGVTGAGKTEMLFAGLRTALEGGQRVCLASPRVDVCLELYPRLQAVFPELAISLLYGRQETPYTYTQLVVCTTHQLLRFKEAFDVVIVDEIDAFPFSHTPFLAYGLAQARKRKSALIYLTATPSPALMREVRAGTLALVTVAMRYHGQSLPVPQSLWLWRYYLKIKQGQLPPVLRHLLETQLARKKMTLLFCPTIDLMGHLEKTLQVAFPETRIESASAKDPLREEKIRHLRHRRYELFLTTTILERGVTFSGIDVIVLGSNHRVFNQGSLVQIAGRVGRSPQEPTGNVYFIHDGWSRAMVLALRQIHAFNQRAKEEGRLP